MNQHLYVLITHNDLDGIGCDVVFRKQFSGDSVLKLISYHEDYNTIDARIKNVIQNDQPERIYITDISPRDPEVIAMLAEYAKEHSVDLFDHHETAQTRFLDYPWARYCSNQCGTLMFEQYFAFMGESNYDLHAFAVLVDDYDRWVKSDPASDQLNQLLFFLGKEAFIARCLKKKHPAYIDLQEEDKLKTYSEMIDRQVEERLNKVIFTPIGQYHAAVLFDHQYQSQLGEAARRRGIDADFLIVIDVSDRKASLRALRDGIHVGNIAKEFYKGGGNEKAAGFQITSLTQLEILNVIFE